MYNDMYLQLQYHTAQFHCSVLCASPIHPSLPLTPGSHSSFIVSIVLAFPEYYIGEILQYIAFSDCLYNLVI